MENVSIYKVKDGDCAWKYARYNLEKRQSVVTNRDIVIEMQRLAKAYNCADVDDFNTKFFSRIGLEFEEKNSISKPEKETPILHQDSAEIKRPDTLMKPIPAESVSIQKSVPVESIKRAVPAESTLVNKPDTIKRDSVKTNSNNSWQNYKVKQDLINGLSSDKEKVIAWNKTFNKSKDNYVIIDKKNYSATVYTWDGKIVKSYEIAVAKNKSDALLKRSDEKRFASTTAGIYTANYRGSGKDDYSTLYNDRVLTISNDGLREKGIGNGETGVALHQVPNGNTDRLEALKKAGCSDENNRTTNGCINFLPEDFDDCMKQIKGVGTKVYILPEDSNNYMCVKNGKLHFAQKNYTGDVATTTSRNDELKKIKIKPINENLRSEAGEMAQTLSDMKETLAKDLGIDNDTYNELAALTLGIAGQETNFGDPLAGAGKFTPYFIKENMVSCINFIKNIAGKKSFNSRGITQMKLGSYTDKDVKAQLKKYDINEDNLNEASKAAIATMIVLAGIYKNELPALKSKMQNLNISKTDALLYCWNEKKQEIKNETATPEKNIYIQNVKKFMNDFSIEQYS